MTTTKPDNPLDRRIAIMELFDSGEMHGSCTVEDIKDHVGGTTMGVTWAVRDLGFTIARRESTRREPTGKGRRTKKVKVPREWARPSEWPPLYELHRRLRKMGMSASATKLANRAVIPERYVEQAISEVFLSNPGTPEAIKRRGVYKKALNKVVKNGMLDTVSVRELAKALGESPDSVPGALLNRVEGLVRVATRQELRESR